MGEVTRKTTVGGRGFHTGPIQLQKEIQDSLYRRHKALSLLFGSGRDYGKRSGEPL